MSDEAKERFRKALLYKKMADLIYVGRLPVDVNEAAPLWRMVGYDKYQTILDATKGHGRSLHQYALDTFGFVPPQMSVATKPGHHTAIIGPYSDVDTPAEDFIARALDPELGAEEGFHSGRGPNAAAALAAAYLNSSAHYLKKSAMDMTVAEKSEQAEEPDQDPSIPVM